MPSMEKSLPSRPRSSQLFINPNLPPNHIPIPIPNSPPISTPKPQGHKRAHSSVSSAHTFSVPHCHYDVPPEKMFKQELEDVANWVSVRELQRDSVVETRMSAPAGGKRKVLEGGDGEIVLGHDGEIKLAKRSGRERGNRRGGKGSTTTHTHSAPGKHPWDPSPRTAARSRFANHRNYRLMEYKGAKDYSGDKMRGWAEEFEEHEKSSDKSIDPQNRMLNFWLASQYLVERKDEAVQTSPVTDFLYSKGAPRIQGLASQYLVEHKDEAVQTSTVVDSNVSLGFDDLSLDFDDSSLGLKKTLQQAIDEYVRTSNAREQSDIALISAKFDLVLEETKGVSNAVSGLVEELRRGLDEVREMVLDVKARQWGEGLKSNKGESASEREPGVECDPDESWQFLEE